LIDGRASEVAALTDLSMTCPAWRIARAHAAAGAPTYRYYFSHAASYGTTVVLGAYHASELQYVFNSFTAMGYLPTPAEETLSQDMEDYWAAHARAGAPNAVGLPTWPQWTTTAEQWLAFDQDATPGPDDHTAQCAMWASLLGWP
jgi:para-nitrobenzyl esterase